MKRRPSKEIAEEGAHAVQAIADGFKGLLRFLGKVTNGEDALEAAATETRRVLRKKSVRKVRGLPAKRRKSRAIVVDAEVVDE